VSTALSRLRYGAEHLHDHLESFRVYAILQPDLRFGIQMRNMAALSLDTGIPGYDFFSHVWHEQSRISLQFLVRHQGAVFRTNFTEWAKRGYQPEDTEIRTQSQGFPRRNSIISADLSWNAGTRIKVYLTGGWRKYTDLARPYTEFTLDSTKTRLRPITNIISAGGHVARTSLRIQFPLSGNLTFKVSGIYAYPWSNMHSFRDAWHHHMQMGVRGEFRPNNRFSMDMRLRYTGPSTWQTWENAARENAEFYSMRLPGTVHAHLTIQKRFWEDRLRMSATMRNVLDHPHITHPAGARTRALFQVAVQYAFRVDKTIPS